MGTVTWLDAVGRIVGITLIVLTCAAVLTSITVVTVRRRRREGARREEIARIVGNIRRRMAEANELDDMR